MLDRLERLGGLALNALAALGRFTLFAGEAFAGMVSPPIHRAQWLRALWNIGYLSLPVVGLTAFFTGSVLALQIYVGGSRFNAESIVPNIVALGIVRELGPVLASLMVAGRVAAAIAAEIGAMRVTEQIDALAAFSVDPIKYLVSPRLAAAIASMPILALLGDSIGIAGGWIVAVNSLGFSSATYLANTVDALLLGDVLSGLVKSAVFGAIIALAGCYYGFHASRGADGVGRAATSAVVVAAILILASDYLMTATFFS